MRSCQGLGMGGVGKEVGMAQKGQQEESSWEWKCRDSLTVQPWLGYCTMTLNDVTTRGSWVKSTPDFPGLGESAVISK